MIGLVDIYTMQNLEQIRINRHLELMQGCREAIKKQYKETMEKMEHDKIQIV